MSKELVYLYFDPTRDFPQRLAPCTIDGVRFQVGGNTLEKRHIESLKDNSTWLRFLSTGVITDVVYYSNEINNKSLAELKTDEIVSLVKRQTTIEDLQKLEGEIAKNKKRTKTVSAAIALKQQELGKVIEIQKQNIRG